MAATLEQIVKVRSELVTWLLRYLRSLIDLPNRDTPPYLAGRQLTDIYVPPDVLKQQCRSDQDRGQLQRRCPWHKHHLALFYLHLARQTAILFLHSTFPISDHSLEPIFILSAIFLDLRSLFVPRFVLATQILVLRLQLIVLNRTVKRPKLPRLDRLFWVSLSILWIDWREVLLILKPETVLRWHREGFRLSWRWKSKAPLGRPPIDHEIGDLIRRMSLENPL